MKNVLITGVDGGIGQGLALKFLSEGYFVIGTTLSDVVDWQHDNLKLFKLDLSKSESIKECADNIINSKISIDILINNAGILIDKEEEGVVVEKLRQTLEVNLIGTIDFTEQMLPLINMEGSHIVNISSSAGSLLLTGSSKSHYPGHYPAYKISKAALNMYTRTLAFRLKDYNTIVSSVNPGWVKTNMGGQNADLEPEVVAVNIFDFAISKPESGNFWLAGEKMPW